ncbi:nuclear pore complex protein NUP133 isoform X2 [Macadamia integrifolia]|uniref:nuclear pore complex protein NUP133 isoform X2 n=1 Tax=Macadamia integrifolia TaxID=60698 RepID=UPI001C4F2FA1|nr:nuclear pore complex protein NUP133 isoform X2 [Macadamia integrifolia]
MFSPATNKSSFGHQKGRHLGHAAPDSPSTPFSTSFENRPSSGTPAPWTSRLSVFARIPPVKKTEKGVDAETIQPVYVGEFPQVVRDAQASFLQKNVPGGAWISGGMDKGTSLSWIVCENRLFVWSYVSPVASRKCFVLEFPPSVIGSGGISSEPSHCNSWMVRFINWDGRRKSSNNVVQQLKSLGIVVCNQKTQALLFWPDISEDGTAPVTIPASFDDSNNLSFSPGVGKASSYRQQQHNRNKDSNLVEPSYFNSLIACAVPNREHVCIALACGSNGELWQFQCTPSGISRKKVSQNFDTSSAQGSDTGKPLVRKGYPRSLIWRFDFHTSDITDREFFLLTDYEIQCFTIKLVPDLSISKRWSHEIIGSDGDQGIKKDLAAQKRIWPLDLQVDDRGKELTVLVATLCMDRISSSSYTQYSLLTMQFRPRIHISPENTEPPRERVLEKKTPLQVIIPKARAEGDNFLFSMRLRVGGKPSGSAIILSGDGTATVSCYWRNSTRLYQFDLPWDAGKVIDASVFPSTEEGEEGAWVVLTEKAGVWVIPEKAVLLGGVEPPERSLSRKGSSNEGAAEERRNLEFGGNIVPRRASSEAWDAGDRQRTMITGIVRRSAQDEESEALLRSLFHDFLLSKQVHGSLENLRNSGAFEKDGEANVFARMSRSIVDTLAKHWTTTRGADIIALSVVSSQLLDKQHKHQRFLQFLALSKCHEELYSKQRDSLQIILEHGEKLAGMIQLRELQNIICQNRSTGIASPSNPSIEIAGSLWGLIQLVGEKARRSTVLLMDRDNAEVFYSKVSDLEEVFYCLEHQLQYIIGGEQPVMVQIQRACELSDACTTLIRSAVNYRHENHAWYPSPEGLTPWCCQPVVRTGLWSLASFMLDLLNEESGVNLSTKSDLYSHLEGLTEDLLETYTGAITAKVERGEDHKGLSGQYWKRRDSLLDFLYLQIKGFVEAKCQDSDEDIEDQREVILKDRSLPLLSIARRHEGYQTMWTICCDLNDTELLRNLMHESMGPKGGFSYFVFEQLYLNHQFAKLLRLGEEFQDELAVFLKQHKDLLWLHEIFLNQFSPASETLHSLALSQVHTPVSVAEEEPDSELTNFMPTLKERKRLLYLSRIAIMAGRDAEFEKKTKCIEAEIAILKLQEEIGKLLPDDLKSQVLGSQLFTPGELIELCLKGQTPMLSLRAFDVFAWTNSSFRKSNRSLLEECWRSIANQDDWGSIYQASIDEGWSEEETLRILRGTFLFQASYKCYGPEAATYEGGFDEVLPLTQNEPQIPGKHVVCSVEGIMLQHKDFPEAGKLMLTALMLGKLGSDMKVENYSPME